MKQISESVRQPAENEVEMVSVTMGAQTAHNLALVCNRARNMLTDFMDAEEEWTFDERDQAMLETLGWASRWLSGAGLDWNDRDV